LKPNISCERDVRTARTGKNPKIRERKSAKKLN
jgi:hypothetical protein